jgi:hypothetical protein
MTLTAYHGGPVMLVVVLVKVEGELSRLDVY